MKVSIGDVRLWFDVLNAGLVPEGPVMREKPVLLALHGGPGFDHTDFKGVLDPLCDVVQVVMYDHRGNGRSDDGDPALWNLARWGDDVRAFCAALGIERPFVLGWSFGGMVAQSYAARYPDEIAGLVLLSTAAQISEDAVRPGVRAARRRGGEGRRAPLSRRSGPGGRGGVHARVLPVLHGEAGPGAPELRRDAPGHPAGGDAPLLLGRGLEDGPAPGPRPTSPARR